MKDKKENFHFFANSHDGNGDRHGYKFVTQKDFKMYSDRNSEKKIDKQIEIYAELSKSQLKKISDGDVYMEFPHGTTVNYRNGSRGINIVCDNDDVVKELTEGLDASFINWQII